MSFERQSRAYLQQEVDVLDQTKDQRLISIITGLEKKHFNKVELLDYTSQMLEFAQFGVVAMAEAKGLTRWDYEAWAGVQAAGKGTMEDTIQETVVEFLSKGYENLPPSLQLLVESNSGEKGKITTGTGGMHYQPAPGTEYERFFMPIGEISKPYTSVGELVPDEFVGINIALMEQRRILEGKKGVKIDLYPRSRIQLEQTLIQMKKLDEAGIDSTLSIVDFRLMPEEVIDQMKESKESRQVFSEASKVVGKVLSEWHKSQKDTGFEIQSVSNQYEEVDSFLNNLQENYEEKSPEWWLVEESKVAISRMKLRARNDDKPYAIMKRLGSYYGSTMPELVKVESAKFVSALPLPDEVAENLVRTLVNESEHDNPVVKEFIEIARRKAWNIVYGKDKVVEEDVSSPLQ